MEVLDGLKIKGINNYLNNQKILFNTYSDLLDKSEITQIDITLEERKTMLATYLMTIGLYYSEDLMKNLNFTDFKSFSKNLTDILVKFIIKNKEASNKREHKEILNEITGIILKTYFTEARREEIFLNFIIEDEEETEFLSFNKIKPILLSLMEELKFFEDIHYIIDYIIIEYKKSTVLEFINREEIEKYEIYYRTDNEEIKEILYKV